MRSLRGLAALTLGGAVSLGCGSYNSDALRDKPLNTAGLVEALRNAGATVRMGDEVEQPFFSVKGRFVSVNGEDVQAFQYADEAAMQREAALVSSDGAKVGTSAPMWAAPPHFYRKGLLIVLYVGETASVRSALDSVLGPQFACR